MSPSKRACSFKVYDHFVPGLEIEAYGVFGEGAPRIRRETALNTSPFISLITTIPVKPGDSHEIVKQISFNGTHGTVIADGDVAEENYGRAIDYRGYQYQIDTIERCDTLVPLRRARRLLRRWYRHYRSLRDDLEMDSIPNVLGRPYV
jgi:hypothetical protein